ncbi:hypothetical protein D9M72_463460 [compost metagenome]
MSTILPCHAWRKASSSFHPLVASEWPRMCCHMDGVTTEVAAALRGSRLGKLMPSAARKLIHHDGRRAMSAMVESVSAGGAVKPFWRSRSLAPRARVSTPTIRVVNPAASQRASLSVRALASEVSPKLNHRSRVGWLSAIDSMDTVLSPASP